MAHNAPDTSSDTPQANAADNAQRIRDYLEALFSGPEGRARARAVLADDLEYHDPMMEARDADDLIEQIEAYGEGGGARNEIREVIADGSRVAALTAFHLPDGRSVSFSQWFWIEEGKIVKIRVIYDPRPFLEMVAGEFPEK